MVSFSVKILRELISAKVGNGTAPHYQYGYQPPFSDSVPPSGVHDFSTTSLGVSRQAENYWGFWSIDKADGDDHQPPAPSTYLY